MPPSFLTFYRLIIASFFLIFFCNKIELKKMIISNKLLFASVAIFGNVVPFNLISLSETKVDSIVAATLIGTMPLFTVLISLLIIKNEKIGLLSMLGIIIGFIGMLVFIEPSRFTLSSNTIFFSFLVVISAFSYGLSANIVKIIRDYSSLEIATFTTILATIFALPVLIINSFTLEKSFLVILTNISLKSLISATILGVICTGLAILIFFNLIKTKNAVFASQSNFLIPCFGAFWSFIFLDEELSQNMLYGLLLIVIGGWMVNYSSKKI